MSAIDDKLKGLLGQRYIAGNAGEVSKFFEKGVSSTRLGVAYAKTHDEVNQIVKLSNDAGSPVFTNYYKYLPEKISDKTGVIIDFKEMKKIERLDSKNLMAHVQCGVTFDEIQKELKKDNLKVQTPAAMKNESVVKNFSNKAVIKASAKYPDSQITNMYVTLADGRLHKSGSHALDELNSDTDDGAAFLSKWYFGSCDIFGVISRASIMIYPIWEKRVVIAYDFDNLNGMLQAMRNVPRTELGIEYLGFDDVYLKSLMGKAGAKYTMAIGFDGMPKYVALQEKIVRELMGEYGGKENKSLSEVILSKIDDAWPAQGEYQSEFVTLFSRAAEFDEMINSEAGKNNIGRGEMGRLFVSLDRGRSVLCVYGILKDGSGIHKFVEDLNVELLNKGAVFETPEGDFSRQVFDKITGYGTLLKRVKEMVDPKGILNPGIIKY